MPSTRTPTLWLGQARCQRVRRLLRLSEAQRKALQDNTVTNKTLDYLRVIAAHAARCTARHGVDSDAVLPTIRGFRIVDHGLSQGIDQPLRLTAF